VSHDRKEGGHRKPKTQWVECQHPECGTKFASTGGPRKFCLQHDPSVSYSDRQPPPSRTRRTL
jgi:hypothetical protein